MFSITTLFSTLTIYKEFRLSFSWLVFSIPCTSSSRWHVHGAEISVTPDGFVAQVLSLQEKVDFAEVGPAGVISLPALTHQVVNFTWTIYRDRQQHLWKERKWMKTLWLRRDANIEQKFNSHSFGFGWQITKHISEIRLESEALKVDEKRLIKSRYTSRTSFVFKLKKMSNLRVVSFSFSSNEKAMLENTFFSLASNGRFGFWRICKRPELDVVMFSYFFPTFLIDRGSFSPKLKINKTHDCDSAECWSGVGFGSGLEK